MAFPLQAVLNVQLLEQLKHVRVGPKKNVQARFVPVTVLVLPGSDLATEAIVKGAIVAGTGGLKFETNTDTPGFAHENQTKPVEASEHYDELRVGKEAMQREMHEQSGEGSSPRGVDIPSRSVCNSSAASVQCVSSSSARVGIAKRVAKLMSAWHAHNATAGR